MTIRTKLLIFIPLLVVLANTVAYFVFQSGKIVQTTYDEMMERILLIEQSAEKAESNLRMLYAYLLNPAAAADGMDAAGDELARLRDRIKEGAGPAYSSESFTPQGYANLLTTLLEYKRSAVSAAEARDFQSAFEHYIEAEKTVGYVREEGQRMVDAELTFYRPIIESVRAETERMNRLGAALFGMNALMGALLAVWISRSITGPVGRLVGVAKQIARGNLRIGPLPQTEDELGILSQAIRQMSADLSILIEKDKESLEMQRLVKELELQALQSQINPHFLFNTLNVLSKMALLEGAEKTSDLIISMSNLLRYSLRKLDKPVTLQEELAHVKEYAAIQQARFRDRITFELQIDAPLQVEIPALTLQPLVENAFLHGVAGMESGAVIRLSISGGADGVLIALSDNGAGMTEETRLSMLRLEAEPDGMRSTGIGTRNVFKRLQLFYGRDDLVEIDSSPGKGTKVVIRIPVGKDGEHKDVPAVDRG
ncbi:sensor histidine kinase [Paenibacillus alkalitolerans]|uniref:sensor histidine kinase n=1 Tax=Paenibacillus alkalitolerans TaxID=2799335 RepID=UPI0018F3108D|nr:histidine kinase [Paenibacillus alkalitolerans]